MVLSKLRRYLLVFVAGLLVACSREPALKNQFLPLHDAALHTYHTGTAVDAERAMLEQLQLIGRAETERVSGLQFDELRGVAYLRLARVREALGKRDEAARDLQTAVRHFRASGRMVAGTTEAEPQAGLVKLAEELEKAVVPAWKRR